MVPAAKYSWQEFDKQTRRLKEEIDKFLHEDWGETGEGLNDDNGGSPNENDNSEKADDDQVPLIQAVFYKSRFIGICG